MKVAGQPIRRKTTTAATNYDEEEVAFLREIVKLKARSPQPTWCEVLEVIKAMGYRKVATPREVQHVRTG